jgi:N-acetylglucosaminyl-diphospho-decaprenol L-rhamnosyltransferase
MSPFTFSIVSHGHGALLHALLSDLDAEPTLAGAPVTVTLNTPEDFDVARWPHLTITVLRNAVPKGFGANHNAAFGECRTRWFVILNPDLRLVGEEPFTALAGTAAAEPGLGAISPQIVNIEGQAEDAVRANLTPWSLVRRRLLGDRTPVDPNKPARAGAPFYWLAGMCVMFDAAAYRAIGGFDERFFLYGEDYDISARLYAAGHALAVDRRVAVCHDARRDSHRSFKHLRWHLGSILRIWASPVFWRITLGRSNLPAQQQWE